MIYLDYAAHAPADPAVLERFCDIERRFPANPNSVHMAGKAAREEMARVTEQIAALTGASPAEVIFTVRPRRTTSPSRASHRRHGILASTSSPHRSSIPRSAAA